MSVLLTNDQMRKADEYTIKTLGVPSQTLMERAGKAIYKKASSLVRKDEKIVCLCGGGNNGGDGFVCARFLKENGYRVSVILTTEKLSQDCSREKSLYDAQNGEYQMGFAGDEKLIVDCLLGTGFQGELRGEVKSWIKKANAQKPRGAKILSADIPSGVNGTNGIANCAIQADYTICLGEIKTGAYLNDGIDYCSAITRADIGITLPEESYATLITDLDVKRHIKPRKRNTHKGSYGSVAIVGGSKEYTGAVMLSASAALRGGAGYTALFVPNGILPYYLLRAPELLIRGLDGEDNLRFGEKGFSKLLGYSAIAYGMGAGVSLSVAEGAKYLIENFTGKLVLDADALNSIAEYLDPITLFKNKKCDVLLTPHIKEFSRLTRKTVQEILENPIESARDFAGRTGVCVLLKNAVSILTDGDEVAVNIRGTAGQAKGGSGDVLSGLIASLLAQGLSAKDGGKVGAYLCGVAAEIAQKEQGDYSLTATHVVEKIAAAFLSLDAFFVPEDTQ